MRTRAGRSKRPFRSRAGRLGDRGGFGLIEVIVAITVGAIGILAIAGLQVSAATQGRIAEARTTQVLAAQEIFEELHRQGYGTATSGAYPVTVDGRSYTVNVVVSDASLRVRRVVAQVPAVGPLGARTFETRIYERRPIPAAP